MSADSPARRFFVYSLLDAADALLYVGVATVLASRLGSHERDKPWFSEVRRIEIEQFPSRRDAARREAERIAVDQPRYNIATPMPEVGHPGLAAQVLGQTCLNGHPLEGGNATIARNGKVVCRTCRRISAPGVSLAQLPGKLGMEMVASGILRHLHYERQGGIRSLIWEHEGVRLTLRSYRVS